SNFTPLTSPTSRNSRVGMTRVLTGIDGLRSERQEIAQQAEAGALALLGMELHAHQMAALDRGDKAAIRRRRGQHVLVILAVIAIGMDEVEVRPLIDIAPERRRFPRRGLVPSDMRDAVFRIRGLKRHDRTGDEIQTLGGAELLAVAGHELHAEADAEEWELAL